MASEGRLDRIAARVRTAAGVLGSAAALPGLHFAWIERDLALGLVFGGAAALVYGYVRSIAWVLEGFAVSRTVARSGAASSVRRDREPPR